MLISTANPLHVRPRSARPQGLLVLEPSRHSGMPLTLLAPGKHLVGSSRECAIQCSAEGLQPQHAMILAGENNVLLKALDSRTWVNESSVSEASLRNGDRLTIGPITFLVRFATDEEAQTVPTATLDFRKPAVNFANKVIEESATETTAEGVKSALSNVDRQLQFPSSISTRLAGQSETVREIPVREIHRPTEELNRQTEDLQHESAFVMPSKEQARLVAQEVELTQLANELTLQSARLKDRATQLSERESEIDRKRAQLAVQNERLIASAQTTRQELADEYSRQLVLWQEWDAAYHRASAELKGQLEVDEKRRSSIQAEHERIVGERAELWRLQAEFDAERSEIAADRVHVAKEVGDLQSLRSVFETERCQQLVELQEREELVAADRREIAAAFDDLLAMQQQLEHDRTEFAAERSSELLQREREMREHSMARSQLHEELLALQAMQIELESSQRSHADELAALQRERMEFELSRDSFNELIAHLEQMEVDLQASGNVQRGLEARIEAVNDENVRLQKELTTWKQASDASGMAITTFGRQPDHHTLVIESITPESPPVPRSNGPVSRVHESVLREICDSPSSSFQGVSYESLLATDVNSEIESSLNELTTAHCGRLDSPTSQEQVESDHLPDRATATFDQPSVAVTLSDVNNRFGFIPISEEASSSQGLASFQTEKSVSGNRSDEEEIPAHFARSLANVSLPAEESNSARDSSVDTLSNLRSQLAQLFDLPADAAEIDSHEPEMAAEPVEEPGGSIVYEPNEPNSTGIGDEETPFRDQSSVEYTLSEYTLSESLEPQTDEIENFSETQPAEFESQIAVNTSAEEEETPWTRRLRELSEVAGTCESPPTSAPAPLASPTTSVSESTEAKNDEDEFSVEAQLARLLGRPLSSISEQKSSAPAALPEQQQSQKPALTSVESHDRSHLAAEPHHKQNKNAVRDEVQSFRAVAQMSVRSALAKHSWKSLRSNVYFSLGLTAMSAGAAVWFCSKVIAGHETELWKAVTCILATSVCGYKLFRSYAHMHAWRSKNVSPAGAPKTVKGASATPNVATAANNITVQ